jgi:hypothetical protein
MTREELKQSGMHKSVCAFFGFDPENLTEFSVPHSYAILQAARGLLFGRKESCLGKAYELIEFFEGSEDKLVAYIYELTQHDLGKP